MVAEPDVSISTILDKKRREQAGRIPETHRASEPRRSSTGIGALRVVKPPAPGPAAGAVGVLALRVAPEHGGPASAATSGTATNDRELDGRRVYAPLRRPSLAGTARPR